MRPSANNVGVRGTSIVAAFLLWLLLGVGPAGRSAWATSFETKSVTCPVCTNAVQVYTVASTNSFGGVDDDGCVHAAGWQPLSVAVWLCPRCCYANGAGEFSRGVGAETARWIRTELRPPATVAPDADQLKTPAWLKFEMALRIQEKDGRDKSSLAALARLASFATRVERQDLSTFTRGPLVEVPEWRQSWDSFVETRKELIAGPTQASVARADIGAATAMLDRATGERDSSSAALLAAWRLSLRGENVQALKALDALGAALKVPGQAAAIAALRESIAHERAFQERFLRYLDDVDRGAGPSPDEPGTLSFAKAEALRRLGRDREANVEYLRALEAGVSLRAFEIARRHLTTASSGVSASVDMAALWRRSLQKSVERLDDPKTSRAAAEELAHSGDREAARLLADRLESRETEVRQSAALALRWIPDVDEATIDALGKAIVAEHDARASIYAASTLASFGDARSVKYFAAMTGPHVERVREIAVEALALLGDAEHSATILSASVSVEVKVRSLSILTNRGHASVEAARDWVTAHGGEPSRLWLKSGFREIGFEVPKDLSSTDGVMAVIRWMEDDRFYVRANALKLLHEATGQRFGWSELPSEYCKAPQRTRVCEEWRKWWETNRAPK
jgi:hypothetical protein